MPFAVIEIKRSPAGPVLENETVTLDCTSPKEAPQELHYSWYKNNILLEDAHSPTLHLPAVTRANTGFYFCEVQNTQGRERSGPVSVVVRCTWPSCGAADIIGGGPKGGWSSCKKPGVPDIVSSPLTQMWTRQPNGDKPVPSSASLHTSPPMFTSVLFRKEFNLMKSCRKHSTYTFSLESLPVDLMLQALYPVSACAPGLYCLSHTHTCAHMCIYIHISLSLCTHVHMLLTYLPTGAPRIRIGLYHKELSSHL